MSHHPHDEALRLIPPDRLRPWARNARTHSKKQVRQIADSIQHFMADELVFGPQSLRIKNLVVLNSDGVL